MDRVDWARVEASLDRMGRHAILKPQGWPSVTQPDRSAFLGDVDTAPRWETPEACIVEVAITGGFFGKDENPNQPVTVEEIYAEARACAAAGASAIHLHVRNDAGYNFLSRERLESIVSPLRHEFPDQLIGGCVVGGVGEWDEMQSVLDARLMDGVPINPTATYCGDHLFVKPVPVLLEKTRRVLETGAALQIAVYTDADVSNADRYLFRSGLVQPGAAWLILPALVGCSPMANPRQMMEGLLRISNAIYDTDPDAKIMVCAAGRASLHLAAAAVALGLHIRVGMEDTVWLWPHRDDKIESNLQAFELAKQLVESLGRRVATSAEYREIIGAPSVAARE